MSYLYGISGNVNKMSEYIIRENNIFNPDSNAMSIGKQLTDYIIIGLKIMLEENYIRLEVYSEEMLEVYEKENNILGFIYAYIFQAISKLYIYGQEESLKSMEKALDTAEKDKIIMPFVELSPYIFDILDKFERKDEFFNVLYNAVKKNYYIYSKAEEDLFTKREIEIIQYVAEGYKQREIAQKLHIALVTVKKHISSIYSKLGVKSKTEALEILKKKNVV